MLKDLETVFWILVQDCSNSTAAKELPLLRFRRLPNVASAFYGAVSELNWHGKLFKQVTNLPVHITTKVIARWNLSVLAVKYIQKHFNINSYIHIYKCLSH